MCSDKTDIDHTVLKNDDHYDSILISFDIEHNSIVRNKTGIPVYLFDVSRRVPGCEFYIVKPGLQRDTGIRVFFPEFPQ